MKKVAVIDLDGTLLKDDKTISLFTTQTLINWQKKGNLLVIATFRSKRKLEKLNLPFKADCTIYNDGAKLKDINGFEIENQINNKNINRYIDLLSKQKVKFGIEINNSFYCNFNNDIVNNDECSYINQFDKMPRNLKGDKIIVLQNDLSDINVNSKRQLSTVLIDGEFMVIKNKNATKEFCLQKYLKKLKINPTDVLVFGNDKNDLGLFKNFQNSVAVENAIELIKNEAKFFTSSNNDDGVAKFLDKYLSEVEND